MEEMTWEQLEFEIRMGMAEDRLESYHKRYILMLYDELCKKTPKQHTCSSCAGTGVVTTRIGFDMGQILSWKRDVS